MPTTHDHCLRLLRTGALATLIAATGCRSGSAVTTIPTTSSAAPVTNSTAVPSTTSSSASPVATSSTTAAPTVAPVTTTTVVAEDALKAQIAADYVKAYGLEADLEAKPSLDQLEARTAEIAPEGSDNYTRLVAVVKGLVQVGDVVRANDTDPVYAATVEGVELVGSAPYTSAVVHACLVDNRVRVNTADQSPTGADVVVYGSGSLTATRIRISVLLTPHGWLPPGLPDDGRTWEGVASCPSA